MQAFVFPGQGAQRRGMGQGLFDEVHEFTSVERDIDDLLGYSLRNLCLQDPNNLLKETQYTQPCLYVVNALYYYKAMAKGERPDFVAGHSVGEYNALLVAGAFDFLTGLRLVKKRGDLMSKARNGGMAAVVGLAVSEVSRLLRDWGFARLDIGNYNSPQQCVISGPLDDVRRASPFFEEAGAKLYAPLAVSAAFHSRYMAEAGAAFTEFLNSFTFHELKVPVISNVTAQPYPQGDATATIRSLLIRQITNSVQWTQSVRYLIDKGVTCFKELGPTPVLTRLIQQTQESLATA